MKKHSGQSSLRQGGLVALERPATNQKPSIATSGDYEGQGAHLSVEVELLHVLVRVADADEGAELRRGLGLGGAGAAGLRLALDGLAPPPPAVAVQVDARRRAEEALLVAVRLLRHLGVEDDDDHVAVLLQVAHHGLARQPLLLGPVQRRPVADPHTKQNASNSLLPLDPLPKSVVVPFQPCSYEGTY